MLMKQYVDSQSVPTRLKNVNSIMILSQKTIRDSEQRDAIKTMSF